MGSELLRPLIQHHGQRQCSSTPQSLARSCEDVTSAFTAIVYWKSVLAVGLYTDLFTHADIQYVSPEYSFLSKWKCNLQEQQHLRRHKLQSVRYSLLIFFSPYNRPHHTVETDP